MALLQLAFGLAFDDLYRLDGLERVDAAWDAFLGTHRPALASRYRAARHNPASLEPREEAALLIEAGPVLDAFIGELFGISEALELLTTAHSRLEPLYRVKWKFVKRQALLGVPGQELVGFDADAALARLLAAIEPDTDAADRRFDELAFARAILAWQQAPVAHEALIEAARHYCAWAVTTPAGQARHRHHVLFRHPLQLDPLNRLHGMRTTETGGVRISTIDPSSIRRRLDHDRSAFALTDPGTDLAGALDEARYCLLCHQQGKDSCSSGLLRDSPGEGLARFRKSPFGEPLTGCPLSERISEFHALKAAGHPVAALAMIVVDNPMAAATGHRICNDCMKACVYQQQTPVDIPQAETRTLKDVLELPWGVEVYSLLTRWNPLNLRQPLPREASGRKVLVVGMGPAGFTLAHHLLNDGHTVLGIDALKIEPMPGLENGVDAFGKRHAFEPIERFSYLQAALDERVMAGFGGVAEYGITVRWDKNFLALIRLLLERREHFALAGGVRFGGTITADDAWAEGFDHVALAVGAGRPTVLDIPNALAPGVRTASDFLMGLQLTGAARTDSIANLQLRLPAVVIGGGLTAIDTATEALAYYTVQVETFLARHEVLCSQQGEAAIVAGWNPPEAALARTFIAHAQALRAERALARSESRPARIAEMLDAWGGVTVAYRKRLIDSPAYTINPEELSQGLAQGVRFAEALTPVRIEVDEQGCACAVTFTRRERDAEGVWTDATGDAATAVLPAFTVLVAAGTHPNTIAALEHAVPDELDGEYFRAFDESGQAISPERGNPKPGHPQMLMAPATDGRRISFFGDVHPSFAGNVVKAMASAKQGWPQLSRVLAARPPASPEPSTDFLARMREQLQARVLRVTPLAPGIIEVVCHAPMAAARFRPGQFYRLQNFEAMARRVKPGEADAARPTRLAMEGIALTGAWVDAAAGLISTIVLEMGGSSDLCRNLEPGEPIVLMGPTGMPTATPAGETVVLVGGGLGNAVLFSIGAALRAAGSRVLYFAGYKRMADRFRVTDIEAAADTVVWCCDEAPGFDPGRAQDCAFQGNVVQALRAWAEGRLTTQAGQTGGPQRPTLALSEADRLIVIGSDRMMAAVAQACRGVLASHLKPGLLAVASVNSPMQCMMKAVCGQCLQPCVDPSTGQVRMVFTCSEQDQPLLEVDFAALTQRLGQNALAEQQTARWIRLCLDAGNTTLPSELKPSGAA